MTDAHQLIFDNFNFSADIVFTGRYCGIANSYIDFPSGFVHFVRSGFAEIDVPGLAPVRVEKPSLVFFPRPHTHRLTPLDAAGVDLVCAATRFNVGYTHPLARSFPEVLVIELEHIPSMKKVLEAFFDEALSSNFCKKQVAEKLCSTLLIYMTRHLVQHGMLDKGLIAALGDKKIVKALEIIHTAYHSKLTLDGVAREIGMSRSQFSACFGKLLGQTFLDYLSAYRINAAKQLLQSNQPVKIVAAQTGFSSSSAFIRKFKEGTGISPGNWGK